jgi:hypothetical protein
MGPSDACGKARSLTGDCSGRYNLKVGHGDPNNKFDPVSGHTVRFLGRYNLKVAHGDPNNKFDPVSGHTVRFFKAELATSSLPRSSALHPNTRASRIFLFSRSVDP